MTIPHHNDCPFIGPVSELKIQFSAIEQDVTEIKGDLKEIKQDLHLIQALETSIKFHGEAVQRAFTGLEKVSERVDRHEKVLNHLQGMKALAITLWTLLSGGLGAVIIKLFT